MEPRKLRWGVLSTARIADAQVRAISMSNNSELAAIASRTLSLAEDWAKQRNVPHAFGSYEEMLASDLIDAVYIGLPNGLHKEWAIKALQNGKHVLCEKPLASNAAEVREIIAAADGTGLKAMEAFMYRFHPQIERMRQLLTSGAIGELKVIRASFGFFLDIPDDVRWSLDLAGGVLMDMGCYCVNVSRIIGGGNPSSVTAHEILTPGGVDATLVGTMKFPNGILATLDCSFRTGIVLQQALSVSGTEGHLSLSDPFHSDEEPVTITIDKASQIDNGGPIEIMEIPGVNHYHIMLEHFADAVLNDHPVAYTLQDSLGNMQTIDALKESARIGKRVEIGS
jgi:D-xylose 1-dehydrogenase (NADP+, D-xylono-1,5-lactone-forming)